MIPEPPEYVVVPGADPSTLTTQQLRNAEASLRREDAFNRELIETRLDAMDKATQQRLNMIDKIYPTEVEKLVHHLREMHDQDVRNISQRFDERDTRTAQAAESSQKALDAALLAAASLVAQQNEANSRAADKTELSFTKQFDQNVKAQAADKESSDQKFEDLKERIDRAQGVDSGKRFQDETHNQQVIRRNSTNGALVAIGTLLIAILSLVAGKLL